MPLSVLLSQYSALIPIVVFLIFLNKIKSWQLWVIFFYCAYSFTNDNLIISRFGKGLEITTLLYYFTIVEYLVFSTYLWSILKNRAFKYILITISVLFTFYCLFYILQNTFKGFDSIQTSIEAIVIITFCIIYLFEEMNQPQVTFIYSSYHFWVVIGILIYLAGTFFFFVYASNLSNDELDSFSIINHISNILKNILFSIAFVIYAKVPKIQNQREYQPFLN
jgi:hypothetical protein